MQPLVDFTGKFHITGSVSSASTYSSDDNLHKKCNKTHEHIKSHSVKVRQRDREVEADNLISERPSMSGASRGRCLTALTDKSCQSDVCNIEQELKFFNEGSGKILS